MSFEPPQTPPPDDEAARGATALLQSPDVAPYWLSAIIESADDAIISKTLEGVIASWNKGAERIFGYTADEAVGKPITILIPKERQREEPVVLARLRAGERIEHYETQRVRKDGTRIDISLTVSPIRGPEGVIVGASKIARDITDRKRNEEERDRLRREVVEAQQALLVELSTPLIPVREGVVVMPLIGSVNAERAAQMLETLLRGVAASGARVAILDVTGVQSVDTYVAEMLVRAARSARLLGAEVVITGIRAGVAQVFVGLGVSLEGVVMRRNLQEGIRCTEELLRRSAA
ncbi:MAG: PAS domain S-box protein [Acidobacteriota bacterium]|nr:PAS domain S-box protein [Acidobacteriota bacterium]